MGLSKKRIFVLSMFKEYFDAFKEFGVVGKALSNQRSSDFEFEFIPLSIPEFCEKGFKGVDGSPYGGGAGMVMRADVLKNVFDKGIFEKFGLTQNDIHVVYTAPRGKVLNHELAVQMGQKLSIQFDKDLVFICGRYEGVDERFLENYVDEYISLGDFILTGGELAVMTILDASLRFVPGVLGNKLSNKDESFSDGKLEYPLYTRPEVFEGKEVPAVLKEGHHKKIEEFRKNESLKMTRKYREDLLS